MLYFEKLSLPKNPKILILGLILLEAVLFITNYKSGTYLIGWDNVMPEFNFGLNLKRSIFSVWQDYRGLGLLDGLAHSANLLHTIYIYILSIFLPESILRYVFIHLTHLVGGLGFYFLAKNVTNNPRASFIGAIFYMLNLGIIQMFYTPLEVFIIHFAAIPFLSLFTINALKKPTPKNLLILFIFSFLSSPQGFVPTLFAVFLILFTFINLSYVYKTRKFKTSLLICAVFLSANIFWLLPYSYSGIKTAGIIKNARINQFSSEEIFQRNKAHGNILDVLTLKGFMIDTVELNPRGPQNLYLMGAWRNHSSSLFYGLIYFIFLTIFIFGGIKIIQKRNFELLPFIFAIGISFFFLANDTIILSNLNDLLRSVFPILAEAYRFPFTKFIILFSFCFTLILTFGIVNIKFNKDEIEKKALIGLFAGIIFLSLPAFQGYFTSPLLKLKLPGEYLSLLKHMQTIDESKRIALFPVFSFWNWEYTSWGNLGSGFLWYGLPQPLLKRSFDPWSSYNEQFYNEMSYAVNNQDRLNFLNVIRKYDIKYILLDSSIQNTLTKEPINYDSLKKFLAKQDFLSQKQFGKLILYEINLETSQVSTIDNNVTLKISPSFSFEKKDNAFNTVGSYIDSDENPDIIPLVPSVFTEKLQSDLEFEAAEYQNEIVLSSKKKFPKLNGSYTLEVPSLPQNEFLVPVDVEAKNGEILFTPIYPSIFINDKEITPVDVPVKISTGISNPRYITFVDIGNTVDLQSSNRKSYLVTSFPNSILISDGRNEEFLSWDTTLTNRSLFYVPISTSEQIKSVKVIIPKFQSSLYFDNMLNNKYEIGDPQFEAFKKPNSLATSEVTKDGVELKAKGASIDLKFYISSLPHSASYIMFVNNKYLSGLTPRFWTDNAFQDRSEVETQLSKTNDLNIIVLPKSENYYSGYGFHFTVRSFGNELARSKLQRISIMPFPAEFLRNIRLVKAEREPLINKFSDKKEASFKKLNPSTYLVGGHFSDNSTLVLSESYDQGWKAYELKSESWIDRIFPFLLGKEIKNHVLVNNWQNGWKLENVKCQMSNVKCQIVIVYLPQYFQYLGFVILILTFIFLLARVGFSLTSKSKSTRMAA